MSKSAIVTGASAGIGSEISRRLCGLGFEVFGIGREFKEPAEGQMFHPIVCDLLDTQQLLQNMITEAVRNNNQEVCEEIKITLLKELDYQFRLQEEKEDEREEGRISRQEEHYRQIDELIRTRNKRKPPKRKKEAQEEKKTQEDELLKDGDKKEPEEKPRKGFLLRKKRSVS